jgi:hypothetical protein
MHACCMMKQQQSGVTTACPPVSGRCAAARASLLVTAPAITSERHGNRVSRRRAAPWRHYTPVSPLPPYAWRRAACCGGTGEPAQQTLL